MKLDRETLKKGGIFILLFSAYYISGRLGLQLAYVNPSATAVWAPTGIALAAFLFFGYKYWPAIFAGAFFVNISINQHLSNSLIIAVGNTLEGLVGAYLVNRFASGKYFYLRSEDVKKFVLYAVLIATAISATIGIGALLFSGLASWRGIESVWFTWWIGDAVGAIIITPLLLLFATEKFKKFERKEIVERVIFLLFVVGISAVGFGEIFQTHPLGFLLIPLLVWPGLRFTQKESAIVTFLIACIAIWATISGVGPFLGIYPTDSLLMLQAYIAVISLTSLILASTVAERKRTENRLSEAYDHALEGWSKALDLRDQATEGHARRVAEISVRLAASMGLGEQELIDIRRGALLHDIGKMGIPDNILFKPGGLNEEEWITMRQHPIYGAQLLSSMSYFDKAKDVAFCHHERWDGSGYPQKLKGSQIPLAARIFAVVDVWDAMRSKRPYRPALDEGEVLSHLRSLSGTHFDPDVVTAFLNLIQTNFVEDSKQI